MSNQNLLGAEQISFCGGKSMLDHCITLVHLVEKYNGGGGIFTAFLDLKEAF